MAEPIELPEVVQGWISEVLDDYSGPITTDVPEHVLKWSRSEGMDLLTDAWEAGGELGVIAWPPEFFEFSDNEVALEYDIPIEKVTDSARIKHLRKALDPEWLDYWLLCVMPMQVAANSGVKGILCFIVELQGQSGPYVLTGWLGRGDAMYLNQRGYYFLSEITDQMILKAWESARQTEGGSSAD